jgi:hypothetical protein
MRLPESYRVRFRTMMGLGHARTIARVYVFTQRVQRGACASSACAVPRAQLSECSAYGNSRGIATSLGRAESSVAQVE